MHSQKGFPFDMRPIPFVCYVLPIVVSLSGCQESDAKNSFVSDCNESLGGGKDALCACVYDNLKDNFSDTQMTRISGLFRGSILESMENLKASGSKSDLDILDRINDVEKVTEGCLKKLK